MYGWDTEACPVRLTLADFCTNAAKGIVAEAVSGTLNSWPFGIVTVYECLTPGIKPEERRKIAVRQNKAATQKGLEAELWGGKIALAADRLDVPYLTNDQAVKVSAAAVSVEVGVAKLEQGLADCGLGLEGVIHLTRQAAQIAGSVGAIRMDSDGVLRTRLGTPVVAGVGYDPDAAPRPPRRPRSPRPRRLARVPTTSGASPPARSSCTWGPPSSSASTWTSRRTCFRPWQDAPLRCTGILAASSPSRWIRPRNGEEETTCLRITPRASRGSRSE